jgi:peroxiredoxin Q/BCP
MIKEGDVAPDFSIKDQSGETVKLSNLRGQKVVLYFYPKDDTPGCTKEACSFRDSNDIYAEKGIKVFGISGDDETSHQNFVSKFNLPFPLLADTDYTVANAYNSYGDKEYGGKVYTGVLRKTFLIDESGKIKKVFNDVNVEEHAGEVLQAFGE